MLSWLILHAQNCVAALGKLSREPLGSLLTIAVIGVALALPAALQLLVRNGEALAGNWQSVRDFSIYLRPAASLGDAANLREYLASRGDIEAVELITAEQALAEFRNTPGFGGVLDTLDENPLPHTLLVRPAAGSSPGEMARLKEELEQRQDVDQIRLDTEWLERLNALLDLARRGIWLAAIVLVSAVVFIIGNTIRLDIQNQRAEIEVAKLLGATDAFVRRPFLYLGFWYGWGGGCVALLILLLGLAILSGPVERLSLLYGGGFQLLGTDGPTVGVLLAGGLLAGLGGAWIAVARHIAAIQPKI